MQYDLAVIIPARTEMFLAKTIESVLKAKKEKTEIIAGLDGDWANPPIIDHPDVSILYYNQSIGQRAITNKAVNLTNAKYIMKLDAHCNISSGFDSQILKGFSDLGENVVQIPVMYNLHAFDWLCTNCGHRTYQGPTPKECEKCKGKMVRDILWEPRLSRRSEFYRFDTTLHFQYWSARKKQIPKEERYVETMSAQGSCFVVSKKNYIDWNICDEAHGSWGNQGTEVACKTWLSGNRLITNRNCWYSHMFRTQGGDFGFPYPQSGRQVENARQYSRKLFLENKWDKQIYPLSWLLDKFKPVPEWHEDKGKEVLDKVMKLGESFYDKKGIRPLKKGIVYYTDNQVNLKLGERVRRIIKKASLDIVSASLRPMNYGSNITIPIKRGYEAYFKQILAALEYSNAEVVFFCEHDWYYHPSHFEFTPPKKDVFYYNDNWWRVRANDGHAVKYETHLLPAICAYRETLLEHYRKAIKRFEQTNFSVKSILRTGFEPGTHNRDERPTDYKAEGWQSKYPNLDIRHGNNLTASKWKPSDFRSQRSCRNWQETKAWEIDGWKFKTPYNIIEVKPII